MIDRLGQEKQAHIKISQYYLQIWLFSFLGQVWTCLKIMEEAEIHNKKWPANKMTQAHTVDHPISHLSSLSNAPMLRTRVGLGQYHSSVTFQISVKFVKKKSRSKRLGDVWKTREYNKECEIRWVESSNIMNLIYETVIFNQYISKNITGPSDKILAAFLFQSEGADFSNHNYSPLGFSDLPTFLL